MKVILKVMSVMLVLLFPLFISCNQEVPEDKKQEDKVCKHSWEDVGEAATCTTAGYSLLKCTLCGETQDREEIAAFGHDMDEGSITTDALPPELGVITYSCKREGCTHSTEETYLYFGTKEPTEAKEIGDIVFADGSTTPYSEDLELNAVQKSKITDVIFYTGEAPDTIGDRILGVSVVNSGSNNYAWCSADSKFATTGGTSYSTNNGKNYWSKICTGDPEGSSEEKRAVMYPAFDYVLSNFSTNYYIPASGELYKIYNQKGIVNSVIKLCNGSEMKEIFIASSYAASNNLQCHYVRFSDGHGGGYPKTTPAKVCAIREF